jgi:citrate lyase subunit beta/citryl-CoA lyase
MGIPTTALGRSSATGGGDPLHHVLGRILVAARAHGLQALDGPHPAIKDLDGLAAASARAAAMGYDGKWVLHPDQVDVVNDAFTPEQADFDRACRVLEAYDHVTSAEGGATGAVLLDGEMVDEATRAMALVVMRKGTAAGLTWSGSTD